MRHSDFASVRDGLKGKAFAAIIIGLCIIVGFCPQTTEPAPRDSSASPGFSNSNNNAFLSMPVQIDGEPCTLKCSDNPSRKTMSATSKETSFLKYRLMSQTSYDSGICLSYFSGKRGADFKTVCQLLNLPPPSTLSWLRGELSGIANGNKISLHLSKEHPDHSWVLSSNRHNLSHRVCQWTFLPCHNLPCSHFFACKINKKEFWKWLRGTFTH